MKKENKYAKLDVVKCDTPEKLEVVKRALAGKEKLEAIKHPIVRAEGLCNKLIDSFRKEVVIELQRRGISNWIDLEALCTDADIIYALENEFSPVTVADAILF